MILQIPKVYLYYKKVHVLTQTLLYIFHYKAIISWKFFELFTTPQEHIWINDTSKKLCLKTFKMTLIYCFESIALEVISLTKGAFIDFNKALKITLYMPTPKKGQTL